MATPESLVCLETCPHAFCYTLLICITGLLDPLSTGLYGESSLPLNHIAILPTELIPKTTPTRLCCDGGRPQDNYCALLRPLLLSSLLGMNTDPNSRSSPSASSS